jgi:tetratricopeptide (TPR) repeat protein
MRTHRTVLVAVAALGALAALAVAAWLLLPNLPPPKPWQGLTPEAYARLNEHRLIGTALIENAGFDAGGVPRAAEEFRAIQKEQPGLALGFVDEAVVLLQTKEKAQAAVEAAEKGVKRSPGTALPRLVLAQAYTAASEPEKATQALEEAVKLEPRNPRALGALVSQLQNLPGDHPQLYDLRKQLADLAPDNLAAQVGWLRAQADKNDYQGALANLERISALLPRIPKSSEEYFLTARKELPRGSEAGITAARTLTNTLVSHPAYPLSQNAVYGNSNDPADLLMRDWDTPPPALPAPPLADPKVTWKDVTQEAGLGSLTVQGAAPIGVGDMDLWPDAGKRVGTETNHIQDRPDLVLPASPPAVLLNRGHAFGAGGASPIAGASALLADLNNDFSLDVYVAGPSGDQVWTNPLGSPPGDALLFQGGGRPLKMASATPGKGPGTAMAVDLDQDGDLDIIRTSGAADQPAIRYLRNNGNMLFSDLTGPAGLTVPSMGARQTVFGDFDGDGDPDLFVVRAGGPPQLFLNQRQDAFTNGSKEWGLKAEAGALSASVADFDRDGDWDIAVAGRAPHGTLIYRNEGQKFVADRGALQALGDFQAEWVEFLDFDNDGWLDLVLAGKGGLRLLRNEGGKFVDGGAPLAEPCTWVKALDYDQDGDMDLLAVTAAGKVRLLSNEGGNARPWMKVELQGLHAQPEQGTQGNNSYAIGAEVEPRTAWDAPKLLVTEPQTHVGLGRADRAVALRVTWTHGVPQSKVAPQKGAAVHFKQSPSGSCPFLYTWDGEKWRFACDFNWRSPLGMLFARGVPIPHGQTMDWVKIPGETIQPIGSYYGLIATEELREVSYFDMIRFEAVDHPGDTAVYVDERFRMGPPAPFRLYTVKNPRLPASARNDAGEDLLPALKARDNVYTPVPPGPYRGVRQPHDLVLDLGAVPDPANVTLFLNGWIYPASTSTNVAAAQDPGLRIIPPTLSVGDGHGGWTEVDRNVGLPSGKRKTLVLDLSRKFTSKDYRVKLTTTMEIRWDAAFFTSGEEQSPYRETVIPLAEADLRERGYGARYREGEDGPDLFDYNRPLAGDQAPHWPDIAGTYTKLGDCAPLLQSVDDQYAIVAPGDEIRLLFDARALPPVLPGWKRDFILVSDGWTKDTDKNTVSGEAVGPLPFHGMKRYPYGPDEQFPGDPAHEAWRREWNRRTKGRAL